VRLTQWQCVCLTCDSKWQSERKRRRCTGCSAPLQSVITGTQRGGQLAELTYYYPPAETAGATPRREDHEWIE